MRIQIPPRSRAVAPPILALIFFLLPSLSGCFGGAEVRDPRSEVALEKSHWLFPLYHYRERDGRRVVRPFFLIPISLGGKHASQVSSANGTLSDDESERLTGTDKPAWNDAAITGADRHPSGMGQQPSDVVEPGVWGSSQPQREATLGTGGISREHEVRAGETLYAISRQYYGQGAQWTRIAEANRDRIGNPTSLGIGVRLRIP